MSAIRVAQLVRIVESLEQQLEQERSRSKALALEVERLKALLPPETVESGGQ